MSSYRIITSNNWYTEQWLMEIIFTSRWMSVTWDEPEACCHTINKHCACILYNMSSISVVCCELHLICMINSGHLLSVFLAILLCPFILCKAAFYAVISYRDSWFHLKHCNLHCIATYLSWHARWHKAQTCKHTVIYTIYLMSLGW